MKCDVLNSVSLRCSVGVDARGIEYLRLKLNFEEAEL